MTLRPVTPEAYTLLQEGALALAAMSRTGLRVDVAYLDRVIQDTRQRMAELQDALRSDEVYKTWEKRYGTGMKLNSPAQMGVVVFDLLGHKRNPLRKTDSGEASNDERAFKHLVRTVPFVKNYFEIKKLDKGVGTFLSGIRREVTDGFIHPFQDMYTTESYRSSSSRPNFHNQPVRNKDTAEIVRRCIVPRPSCKIVASDYNAQEVRSSCFYHHDPVFEKYVLGGADMHADSAMDCYLLSREELGDTGKGNPGALVRYNAKNKFVFPGFYGSYHAQMTPDLWDAIEEFDLTTAQGVPLYEHLKRKGVKTRGPCDPDTDPPPGTLQYVVKEAQRRFWDRFRVYDQWKRDWWALYQRQGGVNTLSGFCLAGMMRRNQVLCNANQGTAFHCLLWSIVEIRRELLRRRMKAKLILQVHDALYGDVPESEVGEYAALVKEVCEQRVRRHWDWISVPLKMEFSVCHPTWFDEKPLAA